MTLNKEILCFLVLILLILIGSILGIFNGYRTTHNTEIESFTDPTTIPNITVPTTTNYLLRTINQSLIPITNIRNKTLDNQDKLNDITTRINELTKKMAKSNISKKNDSYSVSGNLIFY